MLVFELKEVNQSNKEFFSYYSSKIQEKKFASVSQLIDIVIFEKCESEYFLRTKPEGNS